MTRVAIQGIVGSYSEAAAVAIFGESVKLVECASFDGVFGAIRSGLATHAVVPVHNSTVGKIAATNNLILRDRSRVTARHSMLVEHVLAALPEVDLKDLETIRSHTEAFKQCSRFLSQNSRIEQIAGFDTASSVRSVMVDRLGRQGAICSERAAEIYGATVLQKNIADRRGNTTTFAVIESEGK